MESEFFYKAISGFYDSPAEALEILEQYQETINSKNFNIKDFVKKQLTAYKRRAKNKIPHKVEYLENEIKSFRGTYNPFLPRRSTLDIDNPEASYGRHVQRKFSLGQLEKDTGDEPF